MKKFIPKEYCTCSKSDGYTGLHEASRQLNWEEVIFICGTCRRPPLNTWLMYLKLCLKCENVWFSTPYETECLHCSMGAGYDYWSWKRAAQLEAS